MHINDSKLNNNNNRSSNNNYHQQQSNKLSKATTKTTSLSNKNTRDNDANSASVMSNLSSYSLIDDDHIDDQETINVGNLIIDLESDLEKEKIENEQANAKPNACTTSSAPLSSSSSSSSSSSNSSSTFGAKASSSTTISNNLPTQATTPGGKSNQKSSNKHSNISINNAINNNNSNLINSISSVGGGVGSGPASNIVNNNNNGHLMTTRTVFKSSADERGELKMRITRETKPGKSEHKIVTSPNQKSPTFNSNNNNSTSHVSNFEDIGLNEVNSKTLQSSSISSTKECGTSTSIGTITEPDCLGPCEPGTSVTLEGIVWQETEGGILVVNVTWRGKTYVGALLDCTRHDWAPPRLCDSPASDIDSKAHKGVRTKRIVTRSNGIGLDEKNLLQTTGKLRNGKGRRILTSNDLASCNKRQRESDKTNENSAAQASETNTSTANVSSITNSETACVPMNIDTTPANKQTNNESISTSNIATDKAGPNSPMLIGCSEPNCSKKYRNMNGLLYHQAHAHSSDNDSNNTQDNTCSLPLKDNANKPVSKDEQVEQKEEPSTEISNERQSPTSNELKQDNQDVKMLQGPTEKRRTPSPQISFKPSSKIPLEPPSPSNIAPLNQQEPPRASIIRNLDPDRRSSTSNYAMSNLVDHNRRSPGATRHMNPEHQGLHGFNNHSMSKPTSSSKPQSNPAPPPLPATTEEGMKPSGTSTGPPPAPHQANCYFNTAFMASNYNPYMASFGFPRPMPGMLPYDPIAAPSAQANAFLSRFMGSMRPPSSPESPSRLLSPSIPKNLPFPHYKVDPGVMPGVQTSPMANPTLPTMSPLTNPPPLASGSPLLRMPSQGDPMMPPTSQPPYTPLPGMNPALGLPGPANQIGPLGPKVPSLVDDSLAKQFPRRFN